MSRRTRQVVVTIGLSLALLIAFLAGVVWSVTSPSPAEHYQDFKYKLRTSLNLPKSWYSIPQPHSGTDYTMVGCPDPADSIVLATGGQSNAANTNSSRSQTVAGQEAYMWFMGQCYIATDPVLGAGGSGGSLWPVLASELASESGKPVLLINGAIGGTQVSDWLDERSGYLEAFEQQIKGAIEAGFHPDFFLWHQGETDAAVISDKAILADEFHALLSNLLDLSDTSRAYLFQASRCIGDRRINGVPSVLEAQATAAEADPRIILGMNTDILGRNFRWDECHFNALARPEIVSQVLADIRPYLE
ncbi:sialate O-acetylesterase [Tropicimonas sp. TH_r6]|uniref:sialate O-acetylesterase n=1 Tax=Tropicimonas sp. TH_r6 TaxID=3082085 RepID=UPI0029539D59|nr:sialate O-acetylesterase [Tropicimonas sp. TH_r6]MDV7145543.1 sialate O-acetylesterase [Tropicimonas sp. TH_r6]